MLLAICGLGFALSAFAVVVMRAVRRSRQVERARGGAADGVRGSREEATPFDRRADEAEHLKAQEQSRRRSEEEARIAVEQEAQRKVEGRRRADEESRRAEEDRRRAEE
jgi:hypothetical protein